MTVPEAAVNKEGLLAPDKAYIGISWEFFTVDSIAWVAETAEQIAHRQFRASVSRPHRSHRVAAQLRCFYHCSSLISEPSGRLASASSRRSASQANRFAWVRSVRRNPFCTCRSLITLASKDKVSDLLAILVSG